MLEQVAMLSRPQRGSPETSWICMQSHSKPITQNLGQCKKTGRITQLWGKRPPGEQSQPSSRLKCYSLRMSFSIFYSFQVSCLRDLPYAENHLLPWLRCDMYDTSSFHVTKGMHKGVGGAGEGVWRNPAWVYERLKTWKYNCTLKNPEIKRE